MLAELPEGEARGAIADIYGEIRRLWAVPYVSSLQRHLASRPGWLEWAWAALAPAFTSGRGQTVGWRVAAAVDVGTLPKLSQASLHDMGVDAADARRIGEVCAGFVRVAPVNLMFAGLLRRLLAGDRPAGAGWAGAVWAPPEMLPALPGMVDPAALDDDARAALFRLGTGVDGVPFVPGLYRMLAHWPAYLAYLAECLPPLFDAAATDAARATLLTGIDDAVAALFVDLPAIPDTPTAPATAEHAAVLATLDTYRRTSPEMVVFGRLLAEALPRAKG